MSTANAAHATKCNANDNGTKSTEQNLQNFHSAIVHSKSSENTNLQVAFCTKHDRASIAPAAACGIAYTAQYIY